MTPIAPILLALAQAVSADPARAADLARAGRTEEALATFERIVAVNPADTEARLWIARLDLRLGRVDKAEGSVRSVLAQHPADVDARIVLGSVLTRRGDWRQALQVLTATERDAADNGDLLAALARAYRRAGDDRSAYVYFRRATMLAPTDPELRAGYENAASAYGHAIAVEGFGQRLSSGERTQSGTLTGSVRATPRLHLIGFVRGQSGDALGGGGVQWRAARATSVSFRAAGGSGNVSLANGDVDAGVIHYTGPFEIGGAVRELSFESVDVTALSPTVAWDRGERWRVDARYTYSLSRFHTTGESHGDNSLVLRPTFRATRRVWVSGAYAYGIESFEDLTADRLGQLGSTTAAGTVRIAFRSLTAVYGTWEHQWRSNDSRLDRFTFSLVQYIP